MSTAAKKQKRYYESKEQMQQEALVKVVFYKISLSQDKHKMLDFHKCEPYARYSLRGQNLDVLKQRKTIAWLIDEVVRRVIFNPAFSEWEVAMVFLNPQQNGLFNDLARYYLRWGGKIHFVKPSTWPLATRKIYESLKK